MAWGVRSINLDVRAQMEGLYDFSAPEKDDPRGLYLLAVHSYLAHRDRREVLALRASRLAALSPILKNRAEVVEASGDLVEEYVRDLYSLGEENKAGSMIKAWEETFGVKWGSKEFDQFNAKLDMDREIRRKKRKMESQ